MILATEDTNSRSLKLNRVFEGPVDLIYKVWTDPRLVPLWWGVEGATNPICELDVRPGGRWRIDMRTSTGRLFRNEGVYIEVVENQRLVYSDVPDPGLIEWEGRPPDPRIHTVTFEELNGRTRVTLDVQFSTPPDRERMMKFGMANGLNQSLGRLAALIASLSTREAWPLPDTDSLPFLSEPRLWGGKYQ